MPTRAWWACCAVVVWPAVLVAAPPDPLPLLNLSPLRQVVYQHPDRGPLGPVQGGETSGSLRFGYFAVFSSQQRGDSVILMDLEGARVDLGFGWAPAAGISLGVDLPLVGYYDGVLDSVVEVVDRAVGTPSPQRKDFGRNEYHFRFEHVGRPPFEPAPGHFGLGDAAFEGRARLLDPVADDWAPELSVTGVVEVPTGDARLAHGNGAVDLGAGIEAARSIGDLRLTLALGFVLPGGAPDGLEGVTTRPAVTGLVGLGYALTSTWEVLAQLDLRQSPYRGSELDALDASSSELAVGLRWAPADRPWVLQAGFAEGLVNGASPDFSVVASLGCVFVSGEDHEP